MLFLSIAFWILMSVLIGMIILGFVGKLIFS